MGFRLARPGAVASPLLPRRCRERRIATARMATAVAATGSAPVSSRFATANIVGRLVANRSATTSQSASGSLAGRKRKRAAAASARFDFVGNQGQARRPHVADARRVLQGRSAAQRLIRRHAQHNVWCIWTAPRCSTAAVGCIQCIHACVYSIVSAVVGSQSSCTRRCHCSAPAVHFTQSSCQTA